MTVTGASSGIGLATVQQVLAVGERIAATTRDPKSTSSDELTSLLSTYPTQLLVLRYDPGDASDNVETLISETVSRFGRLDVVVNNAGYALSGVVESISDEEARKQIEVNFWAPVRISRAAVKFFRENNPPSQGGRILTVSSVGGFISNATLAFYSASKFGSFLPTVVQQCYLLTRADTALEGFSEGLRKEMDPTWNIKIIVIQPGGVRTRWAHGNMLDVPIPPAYADPNGIATRFRALNKNHVAMNDPTKGMFPLFSAVTENLTCP